MKVLFKQNWFAPSEPVILPGRGGHGISGRRFKKGEPVDVPDEYRPFLPKTARVLNDDQVARIVEKEPDESSDTLGSVGDLTGSSVASVALTAEEELYQKRRAALEKARAAKAAKKEKAT